MTYFLVHPVGCSCRHLWVPGAMMPSSFPGPMVSSSAQWLWSLISGLDPLSSPYDWGLSWASSDFVPLHHHSGIPALPASCAGLWSTGSCHLLDLVQVFFFWGFLEFACHHGDSLFLSLGRCLIGTGASRLSWFIPFLALAVLWANFALNWFSGNRGFRVVPDCGILVCEHRRWERPLCCLERRTFRNSSVHLLTFPCDSAAAHGPRDVEASQARHRPRPDQHHAAPQPAHHSDDRNGHCLQ